MALIMAITLFGCLGVISRWGTDLLVRSWGWPHWVGTLTVNVLGSMLIGFIMGYPALRDESPWVSWSLSGREWRVAFATGYCGGLTTFSALSWQLFESAFIQGEWPKLILLAVGHVSGGLFAVWLGYRLASVVGGLA